MRTGRPPIPFSPPGASRESPKTICVVPAGELAGCPLWRGWCPRGGNSVAQWHRLLGRWGKDTTSRCSGQAPSQVELTNTNTNTSWASVYESCSVGKGGKPKVGASWVLPGSLLDASWILIECLLHNTTCLLVQQEDMSSCSARTCLLVQQEDLFLSNRNTCLPGRPEDMLLNKKTCLFAQQEDMSSC